MSSIATWDGIHAAETSKAQKARGEAAAARQRGDLVEAARHDRECDRAEAAADYAANRARLLREGKPYDG